MSAYLVSVIRAGVSAMGSAALAAAVALSNDIINPWGEQLVSLAG